MGTFGKYLSIAGGLVLVYLLVRNANAAAQVFNALSSTNVAAIGALQGRSVSVAGGTTIS